MKVYLSVPAAVAKEIEKNRQEQSIQAYIISILREELVPTRELKESEKNKEPVRVE